MQTRSKEILIQFFEYSAHSDTENPSGWKVSFNNTYADGLGYDEMLGLVAAISMPVDRPTLNWLKTKEQHAAWRNNLKNNLNE